MNYSRAVMVIGLAGCLLLLPPVDAGAAQGAPSDPDDAANWARLGHLKPRQKIEVAQTNLAKFKGKFLAWTEEAITLRSMGKKLTIPRDKIHRVWVFGGRKIGKGAFIGLGAGFAVWALYDGPLDSKHGYSALDVDQNLSSAGIGAGIGAFLGALWRKRILFYSRVGGPGSPQTSEPRVSSVTLTPRATHSRPAPGDLTLHISKSWRPFTTERAMELMAATRPTNLQGTNEDVTLAARRRLYLAVSADQ